MDLQADIKWIQQELSEVKDQNLIEAIKNLLYFRNNNTSDALKNKYITQFIDNQLVIMYF